MIISKKKRTDYWFGKYPYCLRFELMEASALRGLDHRDIDRTLRVRKSWGLKMQGRPNFGGSWHSRWKHHQITEETADNLHTVCEFLSCEKRDHKLHLMGDTVYLYCTDLGIINDILLFQFIDPAQTLISQVVLQGDRGSLCLKSSEHQYRTYFRNLSLSSEQSHALKEFLKNQIDLKMSPTLRYWATSTVKNPRDYFFIDHSDHGILTMLNLVCPRVTRKTLPIIVDK